MKKEMVFIGAGVVGTALAVALCKKGWPVEAVNSRRDLSAQRFARLTGAKCQLTPEDAVKTGEIIFLTVPDRTIAEIGDRLAKSKLDLAGKFFFHCSGSLPSTVIAPLKERGAFIASLHPLQSFADLETACTNLPGSIFSFEGDGEAEEIGRKIVEDLGGEFISIETNNKVLYHLGACLISNYTVTLAYAALSLYQKIGFSAQQAKDALLPLLEGTVNNLKFLPPAAALTGPIARGDWQVVAGHLAALAGEETELKSLYQVLGKNTIGVALEKGSINREQAERLREILI